MLLKHLVIVLLLSFLLIPQLNLVLPTSAQSFNFSYHVSIGGIPVAVVNCTANTRGVKVVKFVSLSKLGALNKDVIIRLLESVSKKDPYKLDEGLSYPIVYISNGKNYMVKTGLYYQESGETSGISYSIYAYYTANGVPVLVVLKQRSNEGLIEARITLVESSYPFPGSVDLEETTGVKIVGPLSAVIMVGALIALVNISKYRVDKWYGWDNYKYTF